MGMFLFEINNVTKTFRSSGSSFNAVDHISLKLPSSGLVSIVGKSGCGKSTFLNMLIGIEKPTSGSIVFQNKIINKFSKKQLSKYRLKDISMIYQHYNLLEDLNVTENIALPLLIGGTPKGKATQKARKLLSLFSLDNLANQKCDSLSGGEKQRVAILRALVTDPTVILCDEPTGALDEKNSLMIMEELKRISKTKLVLMVSHNSDLVRKFSDRIITMKNEKIIEDKELGVLSNKNFSKDNHVSYKEKWTNIFVKKLFKKNCFKLFFSFISLTIGFVSICLGVGFINGSDKSQNEALKRNLEIGVSTVSETKYFSISNSPLQLKKNIRPSTLLVDEYIGDLDDIRTCPNTNYFFSPFPKGLFLEKEIKNFEMVPLLDEFIQNNYVYPEIAGDFVDKKLTNIIVNKEFLNEISVNKNESIGKEIFISYETSISYQTGEEENPFINDTFAYKLNLKIVDVIEEFSFMNTPKIYYSYDSLETMLSNEYLKNISLYKGKNISVMDLINESKDDSPECSYSSFVFLKNLNTYDKFFQIIEATTSNDNRLQFESKVYSIGETYQTFISSFKDALFFFLIIGFLVFYLSLE